MTSIWLQAATNMDEVAANHAKGMIVNMSETPCCWSERPILLTSSTKRKLVTDADARVPKFCHDADSVTLYRKTLFEERTTEEQFATVSIFYEGYCIFQL